MTSSDGEKNLSDRNKSSRINTVDGIVELIFESKRYHITYEAFCVDGPLLSMVVLKGLTMAGIFYQSEIPYHPDAERSFLGGFLTVTLRLLNVQK